MIEYRKRGRLASRENPEVAIDDSKSATSKSGTDAIGGWRLVGLVFVFMWFLLGGVAHFVATDTEMRIVPPFIPWPRAVVLVSGVFELLGAAGLLWRPTRRAAAIGLLALTIAVTPAHIYMLQRPELFSVPYWMLVLRIPMQVALLALIAWSSGLLGQRGRAKAP